MHAYPRWEKPCYETILDFDTTMAALFLRGHNRVKVKAQIKSCPPPTTAKATSRPQPNGINTWHHHHHTNTTGYLASSQTSSLSTDNFPRFPSGIHNIIL